MFATKNSARATNVFVVPVVDGVVPGKLLTDRNCFDRGNSFIELNLALKGKGVVMTAGFSREKAKPGRCLRIPLTPLNGFD